jgi:hypothetical protein
MDVQDTGTRGVLEALALVHPRASDPVQAALSFTKLYNWAWHKL